MVHKQRILSQSHRFIAGHDANGDTVVNRNNLYTLIVGDCGASLQTTETETGLLIEINAPVAYVARFVTLLETGLGVTVQQHFDDPMRFMFSRAFIHIASEE